MANIAHWYKILAIFERMVKSAFELEEIKMNGSGLYFVFALFTVALSSGCAEITQTSTQFTPSPVKKNAVLDTQAVAKSTSGYQRTLNAGSRWVSIGRVREGMVFKPVGNVLTVEGVHVREAYIVVQDNVWVGFWLPNEETFSPVDSSVAIRLTSTRG